MSWAGWAISPGAQVSFVPLVRLGDKKEKKKSVRFFFFAIFHFLKLFASHPR